MFMKQYNYKPRSASTSSQGSQSGTQAGAAAGSPPKDVTENSKTSSAIADGQASSPINAAAAGRRRSSAAEKFGGLSAYKRGSQDDKKAAFQDQKVGGGILGGMWDNFTKK